MQNRNRWRRPSGAVFGPKDLCAQSPASLEIRSETLSVTLDAKFPRVFKYQTASGKSLPAALESSRPTIKLNGQLYTASDLDVRVQSTASGVTYVMRVPSLDLELDWRFAIEGNELVFELTKVSEGGGFRLQTLEFPDHYLVRVLQPRGRVKPIAANTGGKNGMNRTRIFSGSRPRTS
jgi:hypothetical protein